MIFVTSPLLLSHLSPSLLLSRGLPVSRFCVCSVSLSCLFCCCVVASVLLSLVAVAAVGAVGAVLLVLLLLMRLFLVSGC